ncbi:hypothetical protein [Acinetobacter sp. YH12023]|uniref:hypothetical protein n=1 Tax=Acinetobacter sp. YH12023 TaxID=2601041 RepID=UPI0015D40099|nr:hypothetical protein [Acinetobacter sp. YH12023]
MTESIDIQNLKTGLNEVLRVFTEKTGVVITDIYVDAKEIDGEVFYDVEIEELQDE